MKNLFIISLLFYCFSMQAQLVYDYAGVSTVVGFQDSVKLKALLNNPHGLHVDEIGNLYIADRFNHAIRKVDTSGQMITLAGTGVAGDIDGPALEASFFEPWDITTDKDGNVYVADAKNNKIRKISVDGIVSTFAGTGNAGFNDNQNPLNGSLFWPSGIEYDSIENVFYIAGHRSHLIRKIDVQNGLTTFVGSKTNFPDNYGSEDGIGSQATFYRPYGLHISEDDFIYVADEWSSNIRKISKDGVVETIGGIDTSGYREGIKDSSTFNYPWDITTDRNNNIYVLDGFNHVIRIIDPETNESRLFAGVVGETGATNGGLLDSRFNGATGLAYKKETGQLFIADAYNHVIRAIDLLESPTLVFSHETPFCEEDSVTVTSDISYYEKYFWYINDVFFKSTDTKFMTFLPDSTTFEVKALGQRANGLFSPEVTSLFNNPYDEACNIIPLVIAKDDQVNTNYFEEINIFPISNDEKTDAGLDDLSFRLIETVPMGFELNNGTLSIVDWNLIDQQNYIMEYEVCDLRHPDACDSATIEITVQLKEIIAEDDSYSIDYRGAYIMSPSSNDETYDVNKEGLIIRLLEPNLSEFQVINNEISIVDWNLIMDTIYMFDYEICYLKFDTICDTAAVKIDILNRKDFETQPLVFANAFSPNNDGVNDYFVIEGLNEAQEFSLFIYNRWGEEVKMFDDYTNNWDGSQSQGKPLPEGTYFYVFSNDNLNYSGYVLLYR